MNIPSFFGSLAACRGSPRNGARPGTRPAVNPLRLTPPAAETPQEHGSQRVGQRTVQLLPVGETWVPTHNSGLLGHRVIDHSGAALATESRPDIHTATAGTAHGSARSRTPAPIPPRPCTCSAMSQGTRPPWTGAWTACRRTHRTASAARAIAGGISAAHASGRGPTRDLDRAGPAPSTWCRP